MVYILRSQAGEIVGLSDTPFVPTDGQTQDEIAARSMVEQAAIFRLSADKHVILADGEDYAVITVQAGGALSVDLDVNGFVETIALTDGVGYLTIEASTTGEVVIRPSDRITYSAAGEGSLIIRAVSEV